MFQRKMMNNNVYTFIGSILGYSLLQLPKFKNELGEKLISKIFIINK